jgi:DNA-binding winged helix-turn-helix (wHTH) protein
VREILSSDASTTVDLVKEPRFRIGVLAIDPSRCKIGTADGVERSIEPKLLRVLLLLYRKRNTPVSRNELLACCWGGRFVSGDAIERVIAKLRKLVSELAPGSFRIITISKIGYELVIEEEAPLLTEGTSLKQGGPLRPLMTAIRQVAARWRSKDR